MAREKKKQSGVTAKREAKNTVFIDLFNIPKYRLMLFQALHPEMKNVKESDITQVTLNPVVLNLPYNDLGMLVKNKLLIFVEAQSTWSINILIRILLYLAMTYQNYIHDNELHVYGSGKLKLPEPEFYVIYTGKRKFESDIISLRNDFWNNQDAKVDLTAKVIYTESKNDIIGQYIIFSHVLDQQKKKYGKTKQAVQETIRICKDEGVLKEYLESREKEVVDIMITLFDQEYAVEAYAREKMKAGEARGEARGAIKEAIKIYHDDLHLSPMMVLQKIIYRFSLQETDARKYVEETLGVTLGEPATVMAEPAAAYDPGKPDGKNG